MKKTIVQTLIGMMVLCLMVACSKGHDKKENEENSSGDQHTYEVSIAGGKTYKGGVPVYQSGAAQSYNTLTSVQDQYYEQNTGVDVLLTDMEGFFQIGFGFLMDSDGNPSRIEGHQYLPDQPFGFAELSTGSPIATYKITGPLGITVENYKEHTLTHADGREYAVASFTLNFSGKFKEEAGGEEVDVTGKIVVAAP